MPKEGFTEGVENIVKSEENFNNKDPKVEMLGQFSLLISTFGRDVQGLIYVADFSGGKIYRVD